MMGGSGGSSSTYLRGLRILRFGRPEGRNAGVGGVGSLYVEKIDLPG